MKPISWVGPTNEQSGYGQACLGYLEGLLRAGIDVRPFNSDPRLIASPMISGLVEKYAKIGPDPVSDIMVFHMDGNVLSTYIEVVKQNKKNNVKNVVYTAFETDSLPSHWAKMFNDMDVVLVPSTANKLAFIKGRVRPEKIHVVPHVINPPTIKSSRIELSDKRKFTFLSIFDMVQKKGWVDLLTAYWQEFKPEEDVCLALKVYPSTKGYTEEGFAYVRGRIGNHRQNMGLLDTATAPIMYIRDFYNDAEMEGLWEQVDAFVLPTRGEGFGLPIAAANMRKKPVVVTRDAGGYMDWLDDSCAYLVKSDWRIMDDVETAMGGGMHYVNQNMKYCDVSDLRAKMRQVHTESVGIKAGLSDAKVNIAYDKIVAHSNENKVISDLIKILGLNDTPRTVKKKLIY